MISEVYNPILGCRVVEEDRQFPQLTEHPGLHVDPEVRSTIEAGATLVNDRFRTARYPLFVHLNEDPDHFMAQVTFPPEIALRAFSQNHKNYHGIQVATSPVYAMPSCEQAVFLRTDRSLDPLPNGVYPERRLQFGACAGFGIGRTVFLEQQHTKERKTPVVAAKEALSVFDGFTIGNELYTRELSAEQLANIRRMAIIFKGYFFEGEPGWLSRAPTDEFLELRAKDVPDIKSSELLPFVLEQSVRVAKSATAKTFRKGEEYKRVRK